MIGEEHLTEDAAQQTLEEDAVPDAPPPEKSSARRSIIWLQAIAFVLGLGLLVYVIRRVGIQPIFDALGRIGLGFFVILAINGLRHVFRTIAMSLSVAPEHRDFNFRHAFAVRLGGEAISFLTFTGPVLGEATKVALLRRRVPLAHGVPALVVDNILYNLSVGVFILSGACVMLAAYDLPMVVSYVLLIIAGSAGLSVLAVLFAAQRRVMLLTWMIDRLGAWGLHPKVLTSRRNQVYELEAKVYDFYTHRRGAFFAMLVINFIAHASSVLEVYITLRMLGYRAEVQAAYVIESLTKVINFVFGFVPGTIGVYEGGTEIVLRTLGYAAATGVTLALVRKAGTVFWTVIGLFILAWRTVPHGARHLTDRSPRLRKIMDSLVFSNMMHRPARTLVSVLGIAVGVLLIVFTVGLAHGVLRERGKREASIGAEIMMRASGTVGFTGAQPFTLPVERAAEVARIEGVRLAVPIGQSIVSSDKGFGSRLVEGIPFEQYASLTGLTIKEGTKFTGQGDEAIVDTVWQKDRNAKVGDTVVLYEKPFRIVGIYEPPGGGRIKIPLQAMQEQLGSEGHVSSILVALANPQEKELVAARLKEKFPDDQLIFMSDLPDIYVTSVPALNVFLNVVVAIAAAISLLVILLAMYTTVTERTRQIGILKSLGMSKASIAWVIEQEALLVSFCGVATGVLLTLAARFALMRVTSLNVEIETRWILVALGVGLLGGTIGALYPALRAARQDAVEALSYE